MLPKNSKHYILPTAEKLGKDSQLVEDVVNFYYTNLRKALSDLRYHNLVVEELGTFKIKASTLPKMIAKYDKHLSILTKDTLDQVTIKNEIEARRDKVIGVQQLIKTEKGRKKKKQDEKRIRKDLGQQETNS